MSSSPSHLVPCGNQTRKALGEGGGGDFIQDGSCRPIGIGVAAVEHETATNEGGFQVRPDSCHDRVTYRFSSHCPKSPPGTRILG